MLSRSDIVRFIQVCTAIGNEASNEGGFVRIERLLKAFQADLIIRPLLVEGMLATNLIAGEDGSTMSKWVVLVDSDTYAVDIPAIEAETVRNPLGSRLRNTIAHELVHSLAFRPTEFGIQLRTSSPSSTKQADLVRDIERETERLSPLLLFPEQSLSELLAGKTKALDLEDLASCLSRFGISRYLLVNRLCLLSTLDERGLLHHRALRNLAVGLGEWSKVGAVIRKWPLFANFDRNVVPEILHRVTSQDRLLATSLFADPAFHICGGSAESIRVTSAARTVGSPNVGDMSIDCMVERTSKRPGSTFLFAVRKVQPEEGASANQQPVVSDSALAHRA